MNTPLRLSPIHELLRSLNGSGRDIKGMPAIVTLPNDRIHASHLGIADLSCLTRFGVKGPGASHWLAGQGIPVPDRPNTWTPLSIAEPTTGGLVARLGLTEFLIEDGWHSTIAPQLTEACQHPPAKVYPVLRQDAAIVICGAASNELLLQTCNINFRSLALQDHPVVLTMMVGVAVTVIPQQRDGQPFYRIWCDGTFGAYLWRTLVAIAEELGGGAIGLESYEF